MEVPDSRKGASSKVESHYRYCVGIDWATECHQICVMDEGRQVVAERQVRHSGESLRTLFDELTTLAEGRPEQIAVGIVKRSQELTLLRQ